MESVDVVVVGLGVMGAATARALTQRGHSVLGLEQFNIGHKRGSSHGASRIFRYSYPEARYVKMAQEALPLWRELEAESGEELLTTTGGIDLGKPLHDHVAALTEAGADHEIIDGREVHRRWEGLSIPPDEPALYQADAGIVAADKAVAAFLSEARRAGASILEDARVNHLSDEGPGVTVALGDDKIRAGAVVVTAGAWHRKFSRVLTCRSTSGQRARPLLTSGATLFLRL